MSSHLHATAFFFFTVNNIYLNVHNQINCEFNTFIFLLEWKILPETKSKLIQGLK